VLDPTIKEDPGVLTCCRNEFNLLLTLHSISTISYLFIYLFIYPFIYLWFYLFIYLFIYLFLDISVDLLMV
jgi:hypothetical protein